VPSGSVNVVPGRCQFSLDLRAHQRAARRHGERHHGRDGRHRRAPRPALHHRSVHEGRRRPQRSRMAEALGNAVDAWACPCSACPAAPATTP
jgi:hypothetical protein